MRRALCQVSALIAILPASAAFADVASEDVWNDFLRIGKNFGQAVTADLRRDGDTLIAENIALDVEMEAGMGEFSVGIERVDFIDQGDGTVIMAYPTPIVLVHTPDAFGDFDAGPEMRMTFELTGDTLVSGDPDALAYRLDAGAARMESRTMATDGIPFEGLTTAEWEGVTASWASSQLGGSISGSYDLSAEVVVYHAEGEGEGADAFKFDYTGNGYTASGTYQRDASEEEVESAFGNLSALGSQRVGSGEFSIEMGGSLPMEIGGTIGQTLQNVSLENGQLSYAMSADGATLDVASRALPMPDASGSIARIEMAAAFPFGVSEGDAPVGFRILFDRLAVSEGIWGLIDPTGQLPHDPATLELDFGADLEFDGAPLSAMALSDEAPFDLTALTLNAFNLRAVGAAIEASGSAVSRGQNEYTAMPDLVGALDVKMVGVTGLIDTLSSMGLMPMEQAAMAQMMIGMLSRPGEEPGSSVARIERTEDGQLLSNGLPLPF